MLILRPQGTDSARVENRDREGRTNKNPESRSAAEGASQDGSEAKNDLSFVRRKGITVENKLEKYDGGMKGWSQLACFARGRRERGHLSHSLAI